MNLLGKYWNSFIHFATVLLTLFSGFLIAPPSVHGEGLWFKFGKFVVAVCIGLWFVPEMTWRSRSQKWQWWSIALVLALGSSGSVFRYTELVGRWSLPYWHDHRVVIGQTLKESTRKDLERLHIDVAKETPGDLLSKAAGDPTRVWVPEELEARERHITILYLLTVFLLASTVVSVSQAAYCANRKR